MTAFDAPRPPASGPTTAVAVAAPPPPDIDPDALHWVFGYGSLIWDPGFPFGEAHLGQVHGYHRAFCIRSTRFRGTRDDPGVVLGLDRGGSCIGMAFQVAPHARRATLVGLFEREMVSGVYRPRMLSVVLPDNRRVRALAFVANRTSPAYERLADAEIVRRLRSCQGQRGPNHEYALRTWHSLAERGVHCPHLGRVARLLQAAGCR
jgi:cation transport protein ChaC